MESLIGLRTPGGAVIGVDGLAVAGGLGKPDVAGDDGGEHLAGEVVLHFLRYLHGQVGAAVEHGQQHAL